MQRDEKNIIPDKEDITVVVIGAGIAGMHAALELVEYGCRVILIEKTPAVGGLLAQLDHQFPDDGCGMCRILPMIGRDACRQVCLRKGLDHDLITIMTNTSVTAVDGRPGSLNVTVVRNPSGVDTNRCTLCRACIDVCPVEVPDMFNAGLGRRKAIYSPVPHQADRITPVIDFQACTHCNACEEVCPENVVRLDAEPETLVLDHIAGVIYAPGAGLFDPAETDVFGYGVLPDVVTALAFERMLSGSGPFAGKPVRPSDGGPIRKIAWVQCVGSRNIMLGADYCSSACCMYAVKEAVLAHQKIDAQVDTAIFYMDMRTFGRDFQRYRDRAEKASGVRFVRCRIHSIEPDDPAGGVKISYVDGAGSFTEEQFDLAVLSTGRSAARNLPDFTSREGVHVLDTVPGFTDIAASVIAAGAASGRVLGQNRDKSLHARGFSAVVDEKSNASALFTRKPAFHLLFYGISDGAYASLDPEAFSVRLAEANLRMPVTRIASISDEKGFSEGIAEIRASGPNRLILVTPAPHAPKIHQWCKWIGLIPSLIRTVDIRPFIEGGGADVNIVQLVRSIEMAVNRLRVRTAGVTEDRFVDQNVLVVGGGPAGLSAALSLADLGLSVAVVEKSDRPGGNAAHIHTPEVRDALHECIDRAEQHPLIRIYPSSSVVSHQGLPGRFIAEVRLPDGGHEIIGHGAAILAVGGQPAETDAYGMGAHEAVISQFALEGLLYATEKVFDPPGSVVMIQCAGSREEPRNYCSRICCAKAIANALRLKKLRPDINIWIFYRDIMTYGDLEKRYTEARVAGIFFIPFDPDQKPSVTIEAGKIVVSGRDPIMGEEIRLSPDLVVPSTGVIPAPANDLARIFNINLTRDSFIQEADAKWRPVDTGREGIFTAGLCRAPANAREAMLEGEAAAYRAYRILSRAYIPAQRNSARVRHAICSQCELCIQTCPYGARYIDLQKRMIMVDAAACQGCGACAAVCPNSASVLTDFEDSGIMDAIEAAL